MQEKIKRIDDAMNSRNKSGLASSDLFAQKKKLMESLTIIKRNYDKI